MGSLEAYDMENQQLLRVTHVVKNDEYVQVGMLRMFLGNVGQVLLGSRLCLLLLVVPLAFVAKCFDFGSPWIFALSLIGLAPLAERVSFLTEQITYSTGPTVGGLLNATCGNATELIIALFALHQRKIQVLKYSLLGSIISNLLLVLGSSLLCGGIANLDKEQRYDRKQVDANSLLLLLGILCQILPILFRFGGLEAPNAATSSVLEMSRASSIVMLIAYAAYIFFQLKTHSRVFESQEIHYITLVFMIFTLEPMGHWSSGIHEMFMSPTKEVGGSSPAKGKIVFEEDNDEEMKEEKAVIGFCRAFIWLVIMTVIIAILSEYVVDTIEVASDTWGISVSFISIILLPIVGNAAEHAGSIIFAYKNKLDISLGVAMGSATQISTFLVPLCVIVAWIMGIPMSLDFGLLQTGCLAFSVLLTALTLQDGSSHYLKGLILCLAYVVIGSCFFVQHVPSSQSHANDLGIELSEKLGISSR